MIFVRQAEGNKKKLFDWEKWGNIIIQYLPIWWMEYRLSFLSRKFCKI